MHSTVPDLIHPTTCTFVRFGVRKSENPRTLRLKSQRLKSLKIIKTKKQRIRTEIKFVLFA